MITHFHPDHVGAAADVHEVSGAPVWQGVLDYAQCELVWGNPNWPHRIQEWFQRHGVPDHVTEELVEQGLCTARSSAISRTRCSSTRAIGVDGWELVAAPGHADGQLVLLRGTASSSRPTTCSGRSRRPSASGPRAARTRSGTTSARSSRRSPSPPGWRCPGTASPLTDPVGRARELIAHHRERLAAAEAALTPEPQSGYELSFALFGGELKPAARRLRGRGDALHLERLVLEERAARGEDDGMVTYTATQ